MLVSATAERSREWEPALHNEDIAPIPAEGRNWSWVNYSTV